MKAALITIDKLKESSILNDNIDDQILMSSLITAQDINLQNILGTTLYFKIQDLVINGDINNKTNIEYQKLITDYIQNYLKFNVLSESVIPLTFKFKSKGVVQNSDPQSGVTPITMKDAQILVNYYEDRSAFFAKRLIEYLIKNHKLFPEYSISNCDPNVLGPANNMYNCGIPLSKD